MASYIQGKNEKSKLTCFEMQKTSISSLSQLSRTMDTASAVLAASSRAPDKQPLVSQEPRKTLVLRKFPLNRLAEADAAQMSARSR